MSTRFHVWRAHIVDLFAGVKVSNISRVSEGKAGEVRRLWETPGALLQRMGNGRALAQTTRDRHHLFSLDGIGCVRAFIGNDRETACQVFRRTLGTWILDEYSIDLPNPVVEGYQARLGYRRRRGGMDFPPMYDQRKARIHRSPVEMDKSTGP